MKPASKTSVRNFLADNTEMGRPEREILKALAGRGEPTPMSKLAQEACPDAVQDVVTTHVHNLRKRLEGSGLKLERVTGYRLVAIEPVTQEREPA